jgi:hypothetical protein
MYIYILTARCLFKYKIYMKLKGKNYKLIFNFTNF